MEISVGAIISNRSDKESLIKAYVDVCNRAISLNRDRFPFKQILGAARAAEKGRIIEVRIQEWPKRNSFIFKIENDLILAELHSACGNCKCDRIWAVGEQYLKRVAGNPDPYIANPALIDWSWMYSAGS